MKLLLAVFNELFDFAFYAVKSFFVPVPSVYHPQVASLSAPRRIMELSAPVEFHEEVPFAPLPDRELMVPTEKSIQKNTIMYTSSIATPLRNAPGATGDAVLTTLSYGSMVMVLKSEDMWAYVASGPFTGWVYVDDLEDRAAHVYPAFHIGEVNHASDPSTERTRAIISDEFGAGDVEAPLQPEEYSLYRLTRRGVKVHWPPIRPRSPGSWATILANMPGVKIGDEPSAGCVLEFLIPKEAGETEGHLAYVEAVFPDNVIQISEVGWPEEGMYNERVLVEAEWKDLKPHFIAFS